MTGGEQDILISKYLDHTLSTEERERFESLRTSDPDFASEIRQMEIFESKITNRIAPSSIAARPEFLARVESDILSKMPLPKNSASGKTWSMYGFITIILGIGIYLFFSKNELQQPTSQLPLPQQDSLRLRSENHNAPISQNPENISAEHKTNGILPYLNTDSIHGDKPQIAQSSGNISSNAPVDADLSELRHLKSIYETTVSSGEYGKASVLAKEIGIHYRELGDPEQSRMFLNQSLIFSRRSGSHETEGDALGELGLSTLAQGQLSKAKSLIAQAVKILHETHSAEEMRWKNELEKLTK